MISTRRKFLKQLATTSAALAGSSWLASIGYTQIVRGPARVLLNRARTRSDLDRHILGSFVEHLGRCVYGGVYDPGSKFADENGFRKDLIEQVKELGVPVVRYPGGNFISGYHWLDSVGPKKDRPTVLDRAWNSLETNQFGTNEFMDWCKLAGAEPLLGFNFGTEPAEMAAALVEYCNVEKGTKWSDLRRQHGYEKPHNVKYFCMGNEMDGPWQMGQLTALEYGRKAADTARQIRVIDPGAKLIACGSSTPELPTYLEWDREVLEQCYDVVDGISLHRYFGNTAPTSGNSSARFLAMNLDMERQIHEISAVCDYVQGLKKTQKQLWLSFDEWNVWYRARTGDAMDGHKTFAPHLLEEVYNLEDAMLVGGFLNSLMRQSDRVRVACMAQLVNVIAPLVTNDAGILRQTTYYPYSWALKYARGQVLDLSVTSETYPIKPDGLQADLAWAGNVPFVDVAATSDPASNQVSIFMLNRDLETERELIIDWSGSPPSRVLACETLTGPDLKAFNTFASPMTVAPRPLDPPNLGTTTTFKLPARSYSVAQFQT